MTIKESIQTYLEWKQTHTSAAYNCYRIRLEQFADFVAPKRLLSEINGDDIIAFHRSLEDKYSLNTIAYSARVLKNFFWFWHGRGQTQFNPKEIIPIRFVSADKDMVSAEDLSDMSDLLGTDNLAELQKKLVIHILWDTGMRLSELLDLKISDINEQGEDGLRTAKVRTRKSMRYNLVIWGETTNDLINRYLGIRICIDAESDNLLINPKTEKPFTPRSIQRWITELSDMAMLDKTITPHSFRHGKANFILDQGGSVRDVSAILRHVKPESSFQYMQLSQKRYKDVARRYLNTFSMSANNFQTA
ncbi:tyrosine-type recombinase/integrase [uncultured Lacinutrix sp.]|uniref:tyrosine-type recombinase/integrase n=1 Tax=uncultured Lacinutrix sp. TaxID=574032 RepID=UPI0026325B0A|nr:tyrosine-type recombinase/integrase [uncultured Lacinutrix sp.]